MRVHLNVVTKSCTLVLYVKTRKVQPKKFMVLNFEADMVLNHIISDNGGIFVLKI